jgi:hypothetical protein
MMNILGFRIVPVLPNHPIYTQSIYDGPYRCRLIVMQDQITAAIMMPAGRMIQKGVPAIIVTCWQPDF